ncbi:MAG: amidase family protein, partial [Steroidobacteraceae bacterium]
MVTAAPAGDNHGTSRRAFLADAICVAACAASPALAKVTAATTASATIDGDKTHSNVAAITRATIAEAEKIHAVHFTEAQRQALAADVPSQVESIAGLRRVPRSLALQPALRFDPRLAGVRYEEQKDEVRLAPADVPALPRASEAVAYAPVTYLSGWIRSRQLTSLQLTEIYLERIARLAPRLHCFITVTADLARAQAMAMDAELKSGKYRGPLHGVPYGIKDVFDTAGIPTTWG